MSRKSTIVFTVIITFVVTLCCLFLAGYLVSSHIVNNFFEKKPGGYLFVHKQSRNSGVRRPIVNVLVISGGGSMGVIPLTILKYIEEHGKVPLSKTIGMYVGTSTGAIIASGLAFDTQKNGVKKPTSAAEALQLYFDFLGPIFHINYMDKLKSCFGFCGASFSHKELAIQLKKHFGNQVIGEASKPLVFPSFDLKNAHVIEFSSWKKQANYATTPIYKLLLDATSAPVAFPPYTLKFNGHQKVNILADGALVANTPSLMAYFAARKAFPNRDIRIISIGDGSYKDVLTPKLSVVSSMGLLAWGHILISVFIHGHSLLSRQYLMDLLAGPGSHLSDYYRINLSVPSAYVRPFDGSKNYINYLHNATEKYVHAERRQLDDLIKTLNNHSH